VEGGGGLMQFDMARCGPWRPRSRGRRTQSMCQQAGSGSSNHRTRC